MISTTISREVANVKIDSKGRILLPVGVREEFDLEPDRRVSIRKTKQGLMVLAARNRGGRSREAEYFRKTETRSGDSASEDREADQSRSRRDEEGLGAQSLGKDR